MTIIYSLLASLINTYVLFLHFTQTQQYMICYLYIFEVGTMDINNKVILQQACVNLKQQLNDVCIQIR